VHPAGYYYEGFLAIQRAVDLSIMSELGGRSASQDVDVQLKSFPYPPYYHDNFISEIQKTLPFFIMSCFLAMAGFICDDVVLEKEKKLKVDN